MHTKPVPISLKIVAWLFIFFGVCSVIEIIVSLLHNNININLGVLGLFIGPGLLRLSRGWRTCALVFIWIALIGLPVFALLALTARGPADLKLFGQLIGHAPKELALVGTAVLFLLALWEYRVLTRPDVRGLFGLVPGQPPAQGADHGTPCPPDVDRRQTDQQ